MAVDLSIVVCTWRRPASLLLNSLHTLSDQSCPPLEVIVVDTNTTPEQTELNRAASEPYPLARFLHAPRDPFNLAKGMNVGIRAARGQYVMATCMEMLFSSNVVETLAGIMEPGCWCESACGVLPKTAPVGDLGTVHARWTELVAACDPIAARRASTGAAMTAEHTWWRAVRGYDEARYPYLNPDVDLERQANLSGLRALLLSWDDCQLIHPEHDLLKDGFQTGGEWYASVTPEKVAGRARNPDGWGEG